MRNWLITATLLFGLAITAGSQAKRNEPIDEVFEKQKEKWAGLRAQYDAEWLNAKRKRFRSIFNEGWVAYSKSAHRYLDDAEVCQLLGEFTDIEIRFPSTSIFKLSHLAFPQDGYHYALTKEEWEEVQEACREYLQTGAGAHPDVLAHWKSVAAGHVPYGLRVRQ